MKKKLIVLAAVMACIAIAATGTLAYFSTADTARNVITSGSISIEVVEKMNQGDTQVDFPKEGITGVMPGTEVSKIVQVENTGANEAWIRVKVESTMISVDNEPLPTDVMSYTVLDGWTQGEDGYYYYEEPVASGEKTTVLFEEVAFAPEMGNEYQNCTANILISAEAVQTANNGETVGEAKGWPAEITE